MDFDRIKGSVEGISLPQESKNKIMSNIKGEKKRIPLVPNLIPRLLMIGICAAVILAFWIASVIPQTSPRHEIILAKAPGFETLDEMEAYSDVIVEGVRLETEEPYISSYGGGYTYSQFQITKVHKDPTGELKAGSIITVLENEVFHERPNVIYHVNGYNMMVPGCGYLLFLNHETSHRDYYVAAGVNFGTVSLEADGRDIPRVMGEDFESYEDIWQAAREKYAG